MPAIRTFRHDTPVGTLCGASRDGTLVASGFADHWQHLVARVTQRYPDDDWRPGLSPASDAVGAYVAGELAAIEDLEVDPGGTEFQRKVWAALRTIPVGETWTYQELAGAIGNAGATRAVGSANGANPVSVVVPCHRVVRADGALGGYGGGPDRKAWLLAHEGARLA